MSSTTDPTAIPVDYDALLQRHLAGVFAERDPYRRMRVLGELYAADAVLFEPDAVAAGRPAISDAVGALLSKLPPDFTFTALGSAVGHHGVARLRWRAGVPGGPAAVTGTDVARVEDGRIKTLHVFLDPAPRRPA